MKIDYRWLAAVVLALIVGFVAGRMKELGHDDDRLAGGATRDGREQMGSEWADGAERARSKRSKHHRERSVKSREEELRGILSDFSFGTHYSKNDPFGDDSYVGSEDPAWAKLCAWVMNASHSDFPGIMDLAEKTGSIDLGRNSDVNELLLQRWSQLNPDAALEWVKLREDEDGPFAIDASIVIIQEAFLHYPQWAVEKLKKIHAERKLLLGDKLLPRDEVDPFGDSEDDTMDLNLIYRRLAMMPAQQRQTLRESLGDELFEFGEMGWLSGMKARMVDVGLDAIESEVSDPETGMVDVGFIEAMALRDWKKAKQWVDQKGGEYRQDFTVWSYAGKENRDTVSAWYLARSVDAEDRKHRISDVLGGIEEEARLSWLLDMEAAGEPVEDAWEHLIEGMASKGRIYDAELYLAKLKNEQRKQEVLKGIYGKMSDKQWGDVEYFTINKEYYEQALANPGFRSHIVAKNREALKKLTAIVDRVERDLGEK